MDNTKIQLYDYEGNYLKTVPMKRWPRQVAFAKDGTIAVASNYIQPYQLTLYRPDGTISEYLPSDKNLLKQQILSVHLSFVEEIWRSDLVDKLF